jgi:hypothetical protein
MGMHIFLRCVLDVPYSDLTARNHCMCLPFAQPFPLYMWSLKSKLLLKNQHSKPPTLKYPKYISLKLPLSEIKEPTIQKKIQNIFGYRS